MTSTRTEFARALANLAKVPCTQYTVTNGTFELGPLGDVPTGWTGTVVVTADSPHGGLYCGELYGSRYIEQTLPATVPVSTIAAFSFWLRGAYDACTGAYTTVRVTTTYTDDSTTTVDCANNANNTYQIFNVQSSLTNSKTVKKIRFQRIAGAEGRLDDIQFNKQLPYFAEALRVLQKQ